MTAKNFPQSVIAKPKKGGEEIRWFIDRGEFVRYKYIDPQTLKDAKKGAVKLVLKTADRYEHYLVVPIKGNRYLMLPQGDETPSGRLWDGEKELEFF